MSSRALRKENESTPTGGDWKEVARINTTRDALVASGLAYAPVNPALRITIDVTVNPEEFPDFDLEQQLSYLRELAKAEVVHVQAVERYI